MKEHNIYTELGLKALQRAATKVAENARKNNFKIPIWENGRIKYLMPDVSTEQSSTHDARSRGV